MTYGVYCLRDCKIGYMNPMLYQSDAVAIRDFAEAARSSTKNVINTYASDKELWKVGEFDDQTAVITPVVPSCVACAIRFVRPVSSDESLDFKSELELQAKARSDQFHQEVMSI